MGGSVAGQTCRGGRGGKGALKQGYAVYSYRCYVTVYISAHGYDETKCRLAIACGRQ